VLDWKLIYILLIIYNTAGLLPFKTTDSLSDSLGYMRLCPHVECNSTNAYSSDYCFWQTLQERTWSH